MLHQIFDMFVQSDETQDRSHGGMGVGLTLVRELVELHRGTVVAHSQGTGKGSEFEVRLPLVRAAGTQPCGPAPHFAKCKAKTAPSAIRVLVIEDQQDNRDMLVMVLELSGMTVYSAASGREGLEVVECKQPDAAIVDIGLPEIDGYEVARRIRAAEQAHQGNVRGITLIALTGYGQPQDIEMAFNAGFDHHLVKPFQPEHLIELLGLANELKNVGK